MADILSVAFAAASAFMWLLSATTVTRESELARRSLFSKWTGEKLDLGGFNVLDGDKQYDLIATLRRQAFFSKVGALFAALSALAMSLGQIAKG